MPQYGFGTGQLYAAQVTGLAAPLRFGALQDVSVDFAADMKMLFGQYQFPLDVARGKTKIEGKASVGTIDVATYNTLFFNQTVATGQTLQAINEQAAVPGTPYQVTVANSATFLMDLGVYDKLTGNPLKQVASLPATGQYSVSALGVYTFASADTLKVMLFNYLYTSASTGQSMTISNALMGAAPVFKLVMSQLYKGKTFTLVLNNCVSDKLSLPFKQDDHMISDITFSAQDDGTGTIGTMSTTG